MKSTLLAIPDVILIEPDLYKDNRGYFFESFNAQKFSKAINREVFFVQDNESKSKQAVLRGLHYQIVKPQAKLVRVTEGKVFDVAVDIRKNSPTFGKWVGAILSADKYHQLWIPEGFAHGFQVLSEIARFQYKVTDYRYPEYERCIRYDDPDIDIQWPAVEYKFPIALPAVLSDKDMQGHYLKNADIFN